MNQQLICILIYSIVTQLIELTGSLEVNCNENEACYYLNDKRQVTKDNQRLPIDDPHFQIGAKLQLTSPPEFEQNENGNPFPLVRIDIYVPRSQTRQRDFFVKIKNVNKEKASLVRDASDLEGDGKYEFPDIVVVAPFTDIEKYIANKYIVFGTTVELLNETYHSSFKFSMNNYVDLFKNEFSIDFELDNGVRLHDRPAPSIKESVFKYNLAPYNDLCKEIRMYDGRTAEEFRKEQIQNLEPDQRQRAIDMPILDFIQLNGHITKIGSVCSTLKNRLSDDLSCFETNSCQSFLKIEKRKQSLYEFHFFIKKPVAYLKAAFSMQNDLRIRYEFICERYKTTTDHLLINDGQRTTINDDLLTGLSSTDRLIYSTNDFLYCGLVLSINTPFRIGNTKIEFEFFKTNLELEMGLFDKGELYIQNGAVHTFW